MNKPTVEQIKEMLRSTGLDGIKSGDNVVRFELLIEQAFAAGRESMKVDTSKNTTGEADVIQLARQAGFAVESANIGKGIMVGWPIPPRGLERFATLVISNFLERTGQYVTNDASREAAIAASSVHVVAIPENIDDARAMALLGMAWLRDNAPDELKAIEQPAAIEDERDAERYRWLRNESWAGYNSGKGLPIVIACDAAMNKKTQFAEEALDEAIDAAITANKEQP